MSLTIQQILLDSERLATRLKEDDSAADVLLSQTQTVYKQIDAMKQYSEETGELNELARQRPHSVLVAGIQQESRHLRELRQENRELRAALEEHQNALEVIMSKYRQQITHLVQVSKLDLSNLYNNQYTQVIRRQSEKMKEMAAVMRMAAQVDERNSVQDIEVLSKLATENQGLRELLDISVKYGSLKTPPPPASTGTESSNVEEKGEEEKEEEEEIEEGEKTVAEAEKKTPQEEKSPTKPAGTMASPPTGANDQALPTSIPSSSSTSTNAPPSVTPPSSHT